MKKLFSWFRPEPKLEIKGNLTYQEQNRLIAEWMSVRFSMSHISDYKDVPTEKLPRYVLNGIAYHKNKQMLLGVIERLVYVSKNAKMTKKKRRLFDFYLHVAKEEILTTNIAKCHTAVVCALQTYLNR